MGYNRWSGRRTERGAVALLVAASLLLLMGVTAIAIDGGNLQTIRADAQGASDHGALAAAWASCHGSNPVSAGRSAAADNGYVHDGSSVVVDVTPEGGPHTYRVTIHTESDATFARAIGSSQLAVEATALAMCETSGGDGYTIFAGSDSCPNDKPGIDWSGSNTQIEGNVHSNSSIRVGGSGNMVNGKGTYRTAYLMSGAITWDPALDNPKQVFDVLAWPVDYDIEDYRPGGAAAIAAGSDYYDFGSDKIDLNGTVADGIYYTTNDIVLSASVNATVTLVTDPTPGSGKGLIELTGSNQVLKPYSEDLLAFSTYQKNPDPLHIDNCDSPAVKMSGSDTEWNGTVFAPGGQIEMSGSSNTSTLKGRLIGWTVRLNGSSLVTAPDASLLVGTTRLALLE